MAHVFVDSSQTLKFDWSGFFCVLNVYSSTPASWIVSGIKYTHNYSSSDHVILFLSSHWSTCHEKTTVHLQNVSTRPFWRRRLCLDVTQVRRLKQDDMETVMTYMCSLTVPFSKCSAHSSSRMVFVSQSQISRL